MILAIKNVLKGDMSTETAARNASKQINDHSAIRAVRVWCVTANTAPTKLQISRGERYDTNTVASIGTLVDRTFQRGSIGRMQLDVGGQ